MPIEVETEADRKLEAGQQVYEAMATVLLDADEATLMYLLASLQNRMTWDRLTPQQRMLCAWLEEELFEDPESGS